MKRTIKSKDKRLRLAVYRSNRHIYAQIIDDEKGKTLVAASSKALLKKVGKLTKTAVAEKLGEQLAQKAAKAGLKLVFFDRRNYRYHGRVKALAEGARKGGLTF